MKKVRRSYGSRQMQLMRVLKGHHGLTLKQLARRMKVSERSVHRYLSILIEHKFIVVNFTSPVDGSKKPVNNYAIKRGMYE